MRSATALFPLDCDVETSPYRLVPEGPPRGELRIGGAKNAALPLIAAALLADEGTTVLHDVPPVRDVQLLLAIIERLGATVEADWETRRVEIDASTLTSQAPDPDLCGQLRGSLMLMGPLLARFGATSMGRPGGCSIGARQFDIHLSGLQRLGANIQQDGPMLRAAASRLRGASILLDLPTHTGTQQLVMAAVKAEGTTRICNAAREPEVAELCRALVEMGAVIEGIGGAELVIHGRPRLRGTETTVGPSRIETALFAMIACLPGGHLTIRNPGAGAQPVLIKIQEMGAKVWQRGADVLEVKAPPSLSPCNMVTWPYPGFPTDSQAPLMALCCFASGRSIIRERMYENRFQQAPELARMGADILVHNDLAVVTGPARLRGADVQATDLQAGAALLLAAMGAEGSTTIHNFGEVLRGYADLDQSLGEIGARLEPAARTQ
ncbi:MAG: UDP-N-acetylglucosamine 1-carboxyvinyltransferase [Planctomyces sp.]|nr:UDP-N-acetylglucosamine 1-carboxyvinyltransferase [Planctomyces sp.]